MLVRTSRGLGTLGQTSSKVGVNVYKNGEPLKDAVYSIYSAFLPKEITGVTPASGWVAVDVPLESGATVQVSVSYDSQTQRKIAHTAAAPGDAMAEFDFKKSAPVESEGPSIWLPIAILAVAATGLYLLKK